MIAMTMAAMLALQPAASAADTTRLNTTFAVPMDSSRALPLGDDKLQHFLMTYTVYTFSYAGDRALGMNRKAALIDAGAAAAAVGIGKEIFDRLHGRRFSGFDLIADLLGGTAAYVVLKQVH